MIHSRYDFPCARISEHAYYKRVCSINSRTYTYNRHRANERKKRSIKIYNISLGNLFNYIFMMLCSVSLNQAYFSGCYSIETSHSHSVCFLLKLRVLRSTGTDFYALTLEQHSRCNIDLYHPLYIAPE